MWQCLRKEPEKREQRTGKGLTRAGWLMTRKQRALTMRELSGFL